MEIKDQIKLAQHIFRLLKVTEITFPIGRTNKGNLGLKFSSTNDDYEIMLDAVPLSTKSMLEDDNNIELKKMLEKYWFDSAWNILENNSPLLHPMKRTSVEDTEITSFNGIEIITTSMIEESSKGTETASQPKKRGRPAGSKNLHVKTPHQETT